ncbi:MAG: PadR family transcriptional regulator [Candidatus Heimdallarchaeota archaeon]
MIGKGLEVTPMEAFFLMVLNNQTSISGSEIVQSIRDNLGLNWTPSPGATYKILQSMEKKEYIEETTQKEQREDQRIRTYNLTKKGKELLPIITSRILKIALFADSCCPNLSLEKGDMIKIIKVGESNKK